MQLPVSTYVIIMTAWGWNALWANVAAVMGWVPASVGTTGRPTLENGHYYEGWAVIDGEDWSTGRFNVGPDGELVALDGEPTGGDYDAGIDLSETSLVAITRHPPLDAMGKDSTGPVVPQR